MSNDELTEKEKQERAKSWLIGQRITKRSFIRDAHDSAMRREELEELKEEVEASGTTEEE